MSSSSFDVAVYGGSPAGIAAAVTASEEGLSVVLISEGKTVGGAISNGVCASDVGVAAAISGFPLRFFERVRQHYCAPDAWRLEPKVAEQIFRTLLSEAAVTLVLEAPIVSARREGSRIASVVTAAGDYCANTFIEASYPGDLIDASGVPFRLGMVDLLDYKEPLAEQRQIVDFFPVEGDPSIFAANPFLEVRGKRHLLKGMPSITFRTCVTKHPGNRRPFSPSANYERFAPSWRAMVHGYAKANPRWQLRISSNGTLRSWFFQIAELPGGKYDLNSGPCSFMNVPTTLSYFTDRNARARFNETLGDYMQNWFVFLQRDDVVPRSVREAFAPFGLCRDEFPDNGGWPYAPYLREGRRIIGSYTMTEADLFTSRQKHDAVALGSYRIDGKLSQIGYLNGAIYRDQGVHARAKVYEIPLASMVPLPGSVSNLLAPMGMSASPVTYGSLRIEPQYMAMGEAAGAAAVAAVRNGTTVQTIDPSVIQHLLRTRGVEFSASKVRQRLRQSKTSEIQSEA